MTNRGCAMPSMQTFLDVVVKPLTALYIITILSVCVVVIFGSIRKWKCFLPQADSANNT